MTALMEVLDAITDVLFCAFAVPATVTAAFVLWVVLRLVRNGS